MKQDTSMHSSTERDTLEARFGLRIGAHLSAAADELPHDITERLRFAREQALARQRLAPAVQPQAAAAPVVLGAGGSAALGERTGPEGGPRWRWLASLLPALGLALGLMAIDEWQWNEQIHVAAEIDSALLADDLPPAAYSDPGFAMFLKATAER